MSFVEYFYFLTQLDYIIFLVNDHILYSLCVLLKVLKVNKIKLKAGLLAY